MIDDRSAALVVRVWLEGPDDAFRARLTAGRLPEAGALTEELTVTVAAQPQDVLDAVEDWLAGFLRRVQGTDGD